MFLCAGTNSVNFKDINIINNYVIDIEYMLVYASNKNVFVNIPCLHRNVMTEQTFIQ